MSSEIPLYFQIFDLVNVKLTNIEPQNNIVFFN